LGIEDTITEEVTRETKLGTKEEKD